MQLLSADGLLIWLGKEYNSKTNATIMCSHETEGSLLKMEIVTVDVQYLEI